MTDNGACVRCGKNYRTWEIGFDWLGREVLSHRCDPKAVRRYRRRLKREQSSNAVEFVCADCGTVSMGTPRSVRCPDCSAKHRATLDKARHARLANLAKAQAAQRCTECGRFARASGLCYYHERKAWVRSLPTYGAA